ncbi:hypothetical protein H5410_031248, partial [Solanum commersonii]
AATLLIVEINETLTSPSWKFTISLDKFPRFNLEKAVCNHNFFMMAPNHWDPSTKIFSHVLRLDDSIRSALTFISQPPGENHLVITIYGATILSFKDEGAIQVSFCLHLLTKKKKKNLMTCFLYHLKL